MGKIIAAFNMTLDGISDHTAGIPDKEIHQHYTNLLNQADSILYGRTTYQLMEYWRTFLDRPSPEPSMNDFAQAIDAIPKIVFSRTLQQLDWPSAQLASSELAATAATLQQTSGKDILVGSKSLIIELINQRLIDELQLCIYPVIAHEGSSLFEHIQQRTLLKLVNIKSFSSGAVILYYQVKR